VPGPTRKKDAERRRRNKDGIETQVVNVDELLAGDVEIPVPPMRLDACEDECSDDCDKHTGEEVPAWHPIAHQAYWSLAASGQVIFMEPSDWMTAYALCETLSRELKAKPIVVPGGEGEASTIQWVIQPVNGSVLSSFLKGWTSLLATEGDRRRLRIELERRKRIDGAAEGDNVVDIVQARADAFKQAARG
jgi:hypothetical protein